MTKKDLQMVAGQIVFDSKMSAKAKMQIFNWLKEADSAQMKAFLLDGKIVELDEQAIEVVNDRFKTSEMMQEMESGTAKTILGIVLAGPVGWAIYRWAKGELNACSKKCGTFAIGSERNSCMKKCEAKVKSVVQARKSRIKK
jgi:carbamoylphosphate synthase large subunit